MSPQFLRDGGTELYELYAVVLDFRYLALFQNEGNFNARVIKNWGQILDLLAYHKNWGKMGEMSEWINHVWHMAEPLVYMIGGLSTRGRLEVQ